VLDKILANKRREIEVEFQDLPTGRLRAAVRGLPPVRDFPGVLARPALSVIAEIKPASPSRGIMARVVDPRALAAAYEAGGADAVSVLTDKAFFGGNLSFLQKARNACSLPILRKDFILDERQVYQSRLAGADALLLIAAALDDLALARLLESAQLAGLHVLAEAHNEMEVARLVSHGCGVIGLNNRDLLDSSVDLGVTERLASLAGDAIVVSASGIHGRADAARAARAGASAVLVGEALMTAGNVGATIKEIKGDLPA
jgi:indole-3-glycerol phosphate synthase